MNRLANESSLYLRQHAGNPVDWYPWGEEALTVAREGRRPILLSIGYSACHWCHVMAHESFENADTAAVMNALFVNIKVDREERPDLDRIYQLAHQALTRRAGGWPLTVFLTPDELLPFFTGTYFPPLPRYGMPSFVEVLQAVRRWFDEQPERIREQNVALMSWFRTSQENEARELPEPRALLRRVRDALVRSFDAEYGGHAGAPKFPHAGELALLRRLADEGDTEAARMLAATLAGMAGGGLQDHLGGGFFRYCVDERWEIPHFEKMLYDNAQLLPHFAAAARDGSEQARAAAEGIVDWLQREMRVTDGGYASALDADSPGGEGAFYGWTRAEFEAALPPPLVDLAITAYGLDKPPNFEGHTWHLQRRVTIKELVDRLKISEPTVRNRLIEIQTRLLQRRETRPRPARDDKRLTAWNALLAAGVARAARSLNRPDWAALSGAVLAFLYRHCWQEEKLCSRYADGKAQGPEFLDDYAFTLDALLEQLAARWDSSWLTWAMALADALLQRFADAENGGFFFTAHHHEPLPQRPKPWLDESTPSGNAVAARALLRLGWLLAEPRYLTAAESTLRAGAATLQQTPYPAGALVLAWLDLHAPAPTVILRVDRENPAEIAHWAESSTALKALVFRIPAFAPDLPPALAGKRYAPGGRAYLCEGMQCSAPIGEPDALWEKIGK